MMQMMMSPNFMMGNQFRMPMMNMGGPMPMGMMGGPMPM